MKKETSDLPMSQKMPKIMVSTYSAGPLNVVFDEESNGGGKCCSPNGSRDTSET